MTGAISHELETLVLGLGLTQTTEMGSELKSKFEKFEMKEGAISFICNNAKSFISNTINVK